MSRHRFVEARSMSRFILSGGRSRGFEDVRRKKERKKERGKGKNKTDPLSRLWLFRKCDESASHDRAANRWPRDLGQYFFYHVVQLPSFRFDVARCIVRRCFAANESRTTRFLPSLPSPRSFSIFEKRPLEGSLKGASRSGKIWIRISRLTEISIITREPANFSVPDNFLLLLDPSTDHRPGLNLDAFIESLVIFIASWSIDK